MVSRMVSNNHQSDGERTDHPDGGEELSDTEIEADGARVKSIEKLDVDRRTLLKRAAAAGAAGMVIPVGSAAATHDDDAHEYNSSYVEAYTPGSEISQYDYDHCASGNYGRRITEAAELIYWGSMETIDPDVYEHMFTLSDHTWVEQRYCDESSWTAYDSIGTVEYRWDSKQANVWVDQPDSKDLTAKPPCYDWTDPGVTNFVFTAVYELASYTDDLGKVIDASETVDALYNDQDPKSGNQVVYEWPYNANGHVISDASNSYDIVVESEHKDLNFEISAYGKEAQFNLWSSVTWLVDRWGYNDEGGYYL